MIPDPRFIDLPVYDRSNSRLVTFLCSLVAKIPEKLLSMGTASRPAGYHYVPFGYLVFYSETEVGADGAKLCRVLFNALTPVYLSDEARIMEDIVGGEKLVYTLHFLPGKNLVEPPTGQGPIF